MKKFYCCDYCDELFETEDACKAHEKDCADKVDFEECRALDKDSIVRQLKDLLEEVEIFDEAYNADILKELTDEVHALAENDSCDCAHDCDCDCDSDCDHDEDDEKLSDTRCEELLKEFEDDVHTDNLYFINGKEYNKDDFYNELRKTLEKDVKPAAKAVAKTAVKKTDDFLTTILDKLDKLD